MEDILRLGNISEHNCKYLERFFFVLDSSDLLKDNNCLRGDNHLYGYVFYQNNLYINCDLPADLEIPLECVGAYVTVKQTGDKLIIRQDWAGSFGLYLYQGKDGEFALSNSFMLLVKHLSRKGVRLRLNEDYAKYWLQEDLASRSVAESLVEEISVVQNEQYVEICLTDPPQVNLKEAYDTSDLYTIGLCSQEGIELIDRWHAKWSRIYASLLGTGKHLSVDITGGMDSRICLAVFLSNHLDHSQVWFSSIKDELATHKEDYAIASLIGERFHFELNTAPWSGERVKVPGNLSGIFTFQLKAGFHKEMYSPRTAFREPRFHVGGAAGEALRGQWVTTKEEFIRQGLLRCHYKTLYCRDETERIYERSYQQGQKKFSHLPDYDDKPFIYLYMWGWNKNHFGKSIIEKLFGNDIVLAPLLDYDLYRLNQVDAGNRDHDLLYALIYDRYCPELLNFPINGNRKIAQATIERARELNRLYPFRAPQISVKDFSVVNGNLPDLDAMASEAAADIRDEQQVAVEVFHDQDIKRAFCEKFGEEPYREAERLLEELDFYPTKQVFTILSEAIVLRYLKETNK